MPYRLAIPAFEKRSEPLSSSTRSIHGISASKSNGWGLGDSAPSFSRSHGGPLLRGLPCKNVRMSDHHSVLGRHVRFLQERHLASLSTLRPDGTLHVVPVGFTWDASQMTAWVITSVTSQKVANVRHGSRACLCQVDGRRWVALEGPACIRDEPNVVREAEARYERRYRSPRPNPARVCLEIAVEQALGSLTS